MTSCILWSILYPLYILSLSFRCIYTDSHQNIDYSHITENRPTDSNNYGPCHGSELSPYRLGFNLRSVYVAFMVDIVTMGQVLLRVLLFRPVSIASQCSVFIHLLPSRSTCFCSAVSEWDAEIWIRTLSFMPSVVSMINSCTGVVVGCHLSVINSLKLISH